VLDCWQQSTVPDVGRERHGSGGRPLPGAGFPLYPLARLPGELGGSVKRGRSPGPGLEYARRRPSRRSHGHEASRGSSRGCGSFPCPSPVLAPGLSCADAGRGGSSRRPRAPWAPHFRGEDITVRLPLRGGVDGLSITLSNRSGMDGSEKPRSARQAPAVRARGWSTSRDSILYPGRGSASWWPLTSPPRSTRSRRESGRCPERHRPGRRLYHYQVLSPCRRSGGRGRGCANSASTGSTCTWCTGRKAGPRGRGRGRSAPVNSDTPARSASRLRAHRRGTRATRRPRPHRPHRNRS
jgi:hypothetical protein